MGHKLLSTFFDDDDADDDCGGDDVEGCHPGSEPLSVSLGKSRL